MTDKELLELAAKATGHKWKWVTCPRYDCEVPGMLLHDEANEVDYYPGWNPLTDDGDALRLVVKLNIRLGGEWGKRAVAFFGIQEFWEPTGDDPYAATRRAIVRAAAEIGKA